MIELFFKRFIMNTKLKAIVQSFEKWHVKEVRTVLLDRLIDYLTAVKKQIPSLHLVLFVHIIPEEESYVKFG